MANSSDQLTDRVLVLGRLTLVRRAITAVAVTISAVLQTCLLPAVVQPADLLPSGLTGVAVLLDRVTSLGGVHIDILLGMLAATAMEYAVHWGYERLFQVQFWDYSSTKCDVNGRICLPFSICWGILSMLAVRYVQPVLEGNAALLPEWAAALAVFLVTLDGILTARVLLTTHDIDALTPRTLLRSKRRRTA